MSKFLDCLNQHILLLDGAMGTMIQDLELSDTAYGGNEYKMLSDLLTLSEPEKIKNIHLEYFRAGAHAVETNTFGASKLRLAEYDFSRVDVREFQGLGRLDLKSLEMDELAYELNVRSARLACGARAEHTKDKFYNGRPLFVVGSVGPSNWVLSATAADLRLATWDQIVDNFYWQVLGLIDGGADVILHETQQDVLELKAAIFGSRKAMKERGVQLPIMAQVTVDAYSKMQIFNTDIHAAMVTIANLGIDAFGINCSIGPELMEASVKKLAEHSPCAISVIPNAGLPESVDGKTVFNLSPEEISNWLEKFIDKYGVNIVGGCCGTTPDHIRAIAKVIEGKKTIPRQPERKVYLSGPQKAILLNSSDGLIRIGERLNVRGSKKVRDAVENEEGVIDQESLEEVVREQVSDLGVEIIDVCMDSNLVSTMDVLPQVVHMQTMDFQGAMCLDSFDADVLVKAIEVYPGRPLINSISMEEFKDGVNKIDAIAPATAPHKPLYIALCTSQKGPAVTAEEKRDITRQIMEKASEYDIEPCQLIVDPNIFPLGSESDEKLNFALETLNSFSLIKELHPELMTTIGVGNLTNGLAKKPYMRKVLTSVFIAEGRKRGLDAAIINPHHYVPVESIDPDDVDLAMKIIFDKDMDAFARLEEIAERKAGKVVKKKNNYESMPLFDSICAKVRDGYKEKMEGKLEVGGVTYGYKDKIVLDVVKTIEKIDPLDFINDHLMKAMKSLGDGFAAGDVSLPHLLKSADVMKHVMHFLESYMKNKSGQGIHDQVSYKGTVVLGTVYQDVHSIGKDLAKTLLENYGYRVIDLGVQVPLQKFIDTAKEVQADAIGLSALLVQTSNHMITVSKMMKEQGMDDAILLIGGAPVNKRHAGYVSMYGQDDPEKMNPLVFYCQSGMEGVKNMDQLMGKDKENYITQNVEELKKHFKKARHLADQEKELLETLPRRVISVNDHEPQINYSSPEILTCTLKDFLPQINRKNLYSLNWFFGGKSSQKRKKVSDEELDELLEHWVKKCDEHKWLQPQAVSGLFPCLSNGEEVILYDPVDQNREVARVHFDVVIGRDKKDIFSAAQYFRPEEGQTKDVIGLQISTGGVNADEAIETFKKEHDNESALYLQGLSDRIAEDMADYCHQHLRTRVAVGDKDGTRYSPGYPAMKGVKFNETLFNLLKADEHLGIQLTDAAEFYPTGTTGAFVCFYKEAGYS